jgi:hypothetical protein
MVDHRLSSVVAAKSTFHRNNKFFKKERSFPLLVVDRALQSFGAILRVPEPGGRLVAQQGQNVMVAEKAAPAMKVPAHPSQCAATRRRTF